MRNTRRVGNCCHCRCAAVVVVALRDASEVLVHVVVGRVLGGEHDLGAEVAGGHRFTDPGFGLFLQVLLPMKDSLRGVGER